MTDTSLAANLPGLQIGSKILVEKIEPTNIKRATVIGVRELESSSKPAKYVAIREPNEPSEANRFNWLELLIRETLGASVSSHTRTNPDPKLWFAKSVAMKYIWQGLRFELEMEGEQRFFIIEYAQQSLHKEKAVNGLIQGLQDLSIEESQGKGDPTTIWIVDWECKVQLVEPKEVQSKRFWSNEYLSHFLVYRNLQRVIVNIVKANHPTKALVDFPDKFR